MKRTRKNRSIKMKHVFSNPDTVAHLWANQSQSDARTGNLYFNCETIYSYGRHFPIARHVKNAQGERAVLFTLRSYSNTTAKHLHIVRHACNHLNVIYCFHPEYNHADNFSHWQSVAEGNAQKLRTARKPEKYLNEIEAQAVQARRYAEFFGLSLPETLQVAFAVSNAEEYHQYTVKKREIAIKEQRAAQRRLQRKFKNELAKWLKGENKRLYTRFNRDYLRFNTITERIETSQNVEIPLRTGRTIYEAIKAGTLKVGDTVLDRYSVHAVNGEIVIGCHTYPTAYLLEFGRELFENETVSI